MRRRHGLDRIGLCQLGPVLRCPAQGLGGIGAGFAVVTPFAFGTGPGRGTGLDQRLRLGRQVIAVDGALSP